MKKKFKATNPAFKSYKSDKYERIFTLLEKSCSDSEDGSSELSSYKLTQKTGITDVYHVLKKLVANGFLEPAGKKRSYLWGVPRGFYQSYKVAA